MKIYLFIAYFLGLPSQQLLSIRLIKVKLMRLRLLICFLNEWTYKTVENVN